MSAIEYDARLDEADTVIRLLVMDIEAVGVEHVSEDWPDLMDTYQAAKAWLVKEDSL